MRREMIIFSCVFLLFADLAVAEVWIDNFEGDALNEKWTPIERRPFAQQPPDWKLEDGILVGRWPNWNGQFLFLEEYPSQDYTIQVKCRIDKVWQVPELASAGIVFRSAGPGESPDDKIIPFYGFGIGDSSARSIIFDSPPKFHVVYGI